MATVSNISSNAFYAPKYQQLKSSMGKPLARDAKKVQANPATSPALESLVDTIRNSTNTTERQAAAQKLETLAKRAWEENDKAMLEKLNGVCEQLKVQFPEPFPGAPVPPGALGYVEVTLKRFGRVLTLAQAPKFEPKNLDPEMTKTVSIIYNSPKSGERYAAAESLVALARKAWEQNDAATLEKLKGVWNEIKGKQPQFPYPDNFGAFDWVLLQFSRILNQAQMPKVDPKNLGPRVAREVAIVLNHPKRTERQAAAGQLAELSRLARGGENPPVSKEQLKTAWEQVQHRSAFGAQPDEDPQVSMSLQEFGSIFERLPFLAPQATPPFTLPQGPPPFAIPPAPVPPPNK